MTTTRTLTPRRIVIAAALLAFAAPLAFLISDDAAQQVGEVSSTDTAPRFRAAAPTAQPDTFTRSFDEDVVVLNVLGNDALTKKARASIQITYWGGSRTPLTLRVDRGSPTRRDRVVVDMSEMFWGSAGFTYRVQDANGNWSQAVAVSVTKTCGAPQFAACPDTPPAP